MPVVRRCVRGLSFKPDDDESIADRDLSSFDPPLLLLSLLCLQAAFLSRLGVLIIGQARRESNRRYGGRIVKLLYAQVYVVSLRTALSARSSRSCCLKILRLSM